MTVSLFSEIDEAKKVATRLGQRNAAVKRATKRRDNTLYRLFETLDQLHIKLREIGKVRALKSLRAKYGDELPARTDDVCIFLLKLTCPKLTTKKCSKYASVLTLVRLKKKPDETVKDFVRANGGINGCVAKEKKLRNRTRKGGGAK